MGKATKKRKAKDVEPEGEEKPTASGGGKPAPTATQIMCIFCHVEPPDSAARVTCRACRKKLIDEIQNYEPPKRKE